ncbi:uncharacterized protein LOC144822619 isoform X4 [Lissotriton helveticus]
MTQITSLGKPHATQQQIAVGYHWFLLCLCRVGAEPTKELKCTVDEQNDCHVGSNAKAPSILPSREKKKIPLPFCQTIHQLLLSHYQQYLSTLKKHLASHYRFCFYSSLLHPIDFL